MRFRLLPMTMVATGMLLAVKVADVVHGGQEFAHGIFVPSVGAETNPPPEAASSSSSSSSSTSSDSGSTSGGSTDSSSTSSSSGGSSDSSGSTSSSGEATSSSSTSSSGGESSSGAADKEKTDKEKSDKEKGDKEKDGKDDKEKGDKEKSEKGDKDEDKNKPKLTLSKPPTAEEQTGGRGLAPGARYFSPIELEILQTLSKRREQIGQWQKDTETKENLLANTEKRIDSKIVEIETLKKEVQAVLDKYNDQEDAKIRSLVKIYESMNPKDAARIFDEIEMPILLMVIDKMSEKKAAPILAAMDANKAKQVTVELAEERKLQTTKAGTAKAPLTTAPVQSPGGR